YHVDPNGLIMLDGQPGASFQEYVAQEQATYRQDGPSIRQPSPAFLASLDASPEHLRALLEAFFVTCPPDPGCTVANDAWQMFSAIADLSRKGDVILPPAVRAGLLRLIATFPDLTAEPVTLDGHSYVAVGIPDKEKTSRGELLVDPATARVVGQAEVPLSHYVNEGACRSKLAQRRGRPHVKDPLPAECALIPIPAAQRVRVVDSYSTGQLQ